ICLFDAENPKRKDHTDFLAPFVRFFDGESLIVVLNKCDRQSRVELIETIAPDFFQHLQQAWDKPADSFYMISARSHLRNPGWDTDASPRHSMDQFDALKNQISNTFVVRGFRIDRRVKNALELKNYIRRRINEETSTDAIRLSDISGKIQEMEKDALQIALNTLKDDDSNPVSGIPPRLYHQLAQQWIGPVGWMIGVWYRILVFGSSISALFHFSNPFRRIRTLMTGSDKARGRDPEDGEDGEFKILEPALRQYRYAILKTWTEIGEELVHARFDPAVRLPGSIAADGRNLESGFSALWISGIETQIRRTSRNLSRIWIQMGFNFPVFAVLFHAGWITAKDFFLGNALPSGYFLHAVLTLFLFLFSSFFIFQICVRIAGSPRRIKTLALSSLESDPLLRQQLSHGPIGTQITRVLDMSAWRSPDED
ncbi:MAG: hypothetical protein AB1659_06730, partial [Thermodesulfobacteriota bacterium]